MLYIAIGDMLFSWDKQYQKCLADNSASGWKLATNGFGRRNYDATAELSAKMEDLNLQASHVLSFYR